MKKAVAFFMLVVTCAIMGNFIVQGGGIQPRANVNYKIEQFRDKNQVGFAGDILTTTYSLENISSHYTLRDGEFVITDTSNEEGVTRFSYYPPVFVNGEDVGNSITTVPPNYVGMHFNKVFPIIRPTIVNTIRYSQMVELEAVMDDVQPSNVASYTFPKLNLAASTNIVNNPASSYLPGDSFTMTYTFANQSLDQIEHINAQIIAPLGTEVTSYTSNFPTNTSTMNGRNLNVNYTGILLNGSDVQDQFGPINTTDTLEITVTFKITSLIFELADYSSSFNAYTGHPQYTDSVIVGKQGEAIPVTEYFDIYYSLSGAINNEQNPPEYQFGVGVSGFNPPIKAGYIFLGWVDADGNSVAHISPTDQGDKTLYAKFSPAQYAITYMLDGGTNHTNNPSTYTYGAGVTSFEKPTKAGYVFLGWNDVNGNPIASISSTDQGDRILYASFKSEEYAITYELDGGTNSTNNPSTYTYGTGVTSFEKPTKAGYKFMGWYDAATAGNEIVSISAVDTGAKALFARWQAETSTTVYSIIYELDKGINDASNPAEYTYGIGVLSFKNPTKAGYTFLGWTDKDGNIIKSISATDTGNKTLYASWKLIDSGTNGKDKPTTLPQTGDVSGGTAPLIVMLFMGSALLLFSVQYKRKYKN